MALVVVLCRASARVRRLVRCGGTCAPVPSRRSPPRWAGDRRGPPPTSEPVFYAFVRAPSVALAISTLKQDRTPGHGWIVFERVMDLRLDVDARFFQSMMTFCRRHLPAKAPHVLDAALERGVDVGADLDLFCTFARACLNARPPLVDAALHRYGRCGRPLSHDILFLLASICRETRRPDLALDLVADLVADAARLVSVKLVSALAACCAEAGGVVGADRAQQLLGLVPAHDIASHGNYPLFGNLIAALLSDGRLDQARRALRLMDDIGQPPSMQIHTQVLAAFCRASRLADALPLFRDMVARRVPVDVPVFSALVASCGPALAADALAELHEYARDSMLLDDDAVTSALVGAYAACGQMGTAEAVFRARSSPGIVPYNALMAACSRREATAPRAFALFAHLKAAGLRPTDVTLVALLNACVQTRDAGRARALLDEFAGAWQVAAGTVHTNCLIRLHAVLGDLAEAERLAARAPTTNVVSWMTVLGACRRFRAVSRAERAFRAILAMPASETASHLACAHVMMSNAYASVRRHADMCRVRQEMTARGLTTSPGRTTLSLSGCTTLFFADDERMRSDAGLRQQHRDMIEAIEQVGYAPDMAMTTKPTSGAEEARESVEMHSVKIALAYALRSSPAGAPIRAAKNRPLCDDCHAAVKHVSVVYKRPIMIRDGSLAHHFQDGSCTCGDVW